MPRIDDIKVQEKVFKKKEYRSWDGNLLEKLKLTEDSDNNSSTSSSEKDKSKTTKNEQTASNNATPVKEKLGFNKGSNRVQLESDQSSDKVQLNPNIGVQLGFASDRA